MTVMGVTMGALIGLPPSLAEVYGSDIKKMYLTKATGISAAAVATRCMLGEKLADMEYGTGLVEDVYKRQILC